MAPTSIDPESDRASSLPQLQPWTESPPCLHRVIAIAFCLFPYFFFQPFTLKTGHDNYLKTWLGASRSSVQTLSVAPTLLTTKGSIRCVWGLLLWTLRPHFKNSPSYTGLCCYLYPLDTLVSLHLLTLVPAILFLWTYAILGRVGFFLPVKSFLISMFKVATQTHN